MARPLRVEYAGAFYHVINRGNAGEAIFKSIRDREKFLEYLEMASDRFLIRIHTYCLMTNHYHLLVETPHANLSQAIKWINVGYAVYFNRKRNRRGHLFQGRYKALLVEADAYLKHLSRYIHLNPLRANMVKELHAYKWSSYPAFIGKQKSPSWLETEWLLSLFGSRTKQAKRNYQKFVDVKDWKSLQDPASGNMAGGFILGGADFVGWIKKTFLNEKKNHKEVPQLAELKSFPDLETILVEVCNQFDCDKKDIVSKGRKKNLPRDVSIYLSCEISGKEKVTLGEYFGGISGAAITMRYKHMVRQLHRNRQLKGNVAKIRKRIMNN